jgi:autotransporter-associated beta strand protein
VDGIIFTAAATNPYTIAASLGLTLTISGVGIMNKSGTRQNFVIDEGGEIVFSNSATAGSNVSILNLDGSTNFLNSSSAGSADIESSAGIVSFADNSTAGSAFMLLHETRLEFFDRSTAGNATIVSSGSTITFYDSSRGGTAQIGLSGGALDISAHNAPGGTIGSLDGDGNVFLGANNLTVGSDQSFTTFSGVIQDGGQNGGTGGSLTKVGSGTLILQGANTYTEDTNINGGLLQVDGSITSNTFVNHRGTLAGNGTINGNVTNNGRSTRDTTLDSKYRAR